MQNLATMTNGELDRALSEAIAAHDDDAAEALFTERSARIEAAQAELRRDNDRELTVILGASRVEIINYFAPVEGDSITLLATRVKGTAAQLEEMADRICPNEWADMIAGRFNGDLNAGLMESQHRASLKAAKATARALRAKAQEI